MKMICRPDVCLFLLLVLVVGLGAAGVSGHKDNMTFLTIGSSLTTSGGVSGGSNNHESKEPSSSQPGETRSSSSDAMP